MAMDGFVHPDFCRVVDALRAQLAGSAGGAAVCVYHHGECVVDIWGGNRDELGSAWTHDTMAPSFSTTKGVASTLLHMMVDRGLLDYGDRVAKHWPEFAQNGKQAITVRQILAHQSGLYHIRQMIDHADRMLDWPYMIRAIEQARPIHEPGTRTGYHGLTYGYLVGELLQRVTGKRFSALVQEELVQPLQLDGMHIGAPKEVLYRAARLLQAGRGILDQRSLLNPDHAAANPVVRLWAQATQQMLRLLGVQLDLESILDALAPRGISSFDFGADETLSAAIPAANGLFTARSLARMYAALANGGELDGIKLLSRRTLQRAIQPQEATAGRLVIPFDLRWRLGYHGVTTTHGVPQRGFGHFGFGGSGAWADPDHRLAVAMIVNCGIGTPLGDLRIMRISGSVLDCVDRRTPQRARHRRPATSSWLQVIDALAG